MREPDALPPAPSTPSIPPSGSPTPYAFEEIQAASLGGEADRLDAQARFLDSQGVLDQLPRLAETAEVLDVGSGTGYWATQLAARVPRGWVVCLDRSPELLGFARARLDQAGVANADFLCQDLRSPGLPTDRFDLVFTSLCLIHVVELDATLAALVRTLKPGGWIACFEPVQDHHGLFDCYPPCPELAFLVERLAEACRERGSDFRAGLRIGHVLDRLGLRDTALRYFGTAPHGPALAAYLEQVFLPIAQAVLATRFPAEELDRRLRAAAGEALRPGTWINFKQTVVLGRKPGPAAD